ncbi:hypothetical protein CTEN210_11923 [Chaetoceros tenuissimus]|uniref:monogalactosyldiacylglycerol synthase n=1 Tax=Chaetoceros tenuissimus TaxID=426638 RepID=A0AAD3D0N1_9STRA|nr:hypothetical protein CTEN210_11923 [Chaetoceros tenuissimus]
MTASDSSTPLKVLFLSSDTGGGHRASAESLGGQFQELFPGSQYNLHDIHTEDGLPPWNRLVDNYKHLSAHPQQWKMFYKITNTEAVNVIFDTAQKMTCEKAMRNSIMEHDPDVVVSVHPMMNNIPALSCQKISQETGRYLPIFTVVTDLATAHSMWFCNGVDRIYIASDECRKIAKDRGNFPDHKITQIGLPIRTQFGQQAELLGDRMSPEGVQYQQSVRQNLGLPVVDKKTVLVMGGGEGVGSLSNIVNALYMEFYDRGIDALILVVCGRNEKLKKDLEIRDWDAMMADARAKQSQSKAFGLRSLSFQSCISGTPDMTTSSQQDGCMEGSVTQKIKRILSSSSIGKIASQNALADLNEINGVATTTKTSRSSSPVSLPPVGEQEDEDAIEVDDEFHIKIGKDDVNYIDSNDAEDDSTSSPQVRDVDLPESSTQKGNVTVVGLGFVTKMAEYMVAADVLISKAGPGTIAEAASLSLPIMLTSFLPGQEEGNVDYVVSGGFGAFIEDKNPDGVAREVGNWLTNEEKAKEMSIKAKSWGAPHAARDIAENIGKIALKWKYINDERERLNAEAEKLKLGTLNLDGDE